MREAGRTDVAFSFRASHVYGEGVAGMIVSQMIASESRTGLLGLSEEE